MKALGFKASHARRPVVRHERHAHAAPARRRSSSDAQKKVEQIEKNFAAGQHHRAERYNQLIDIWTHAREQVTEEMMEELQRADIRATAKRRT